MRNMTFALCVGLLLSACQDTTGGQGPPPQLSPSVQALFEQYLGEPVPRIFAVSVDGQTATYRYCRGLADVCLGVAGQTHKAITGCENRSGGVPCKIYALERRIVWKRSSEPTVAEKKHTAEVDKAVEMAQWSSLCQQAKKGDGPARSAIGAHYRYGWSPAKADLVQAYK